MQLDKIRENNGYVFVDCVKCKKRIYKILAIPIFRMQIHNNGITEYYCDECAKEVQEATR